MFKRRFGIFQRIIFPLFLILAVLVVINKKTAFPTPVLLKGEYIRDDSSDIDVGLWSVPLVYDWDNDGRKDLLVGQRYDDGKTSHGYVSFYKNTGTDAVPRFNSSTRLETDGRCCLDVTAEG
jgi:hypothetical protein